MNDSTEYSRLEYRRLIAWPARLVREEPLLRELFGERESVLDLGCGTGEHSRLLRSFGCDVLGIDRDGAALATARAEGGGVEYSTADLNSIEEIVNGTWDGAICLGNTLPHLLDDETLSSFATGLHRRLNPSGIVLIQILNYDRILERGEWSLPLNRRPGDDGELVFMRLMETRENGVVIFCPTTLSFRPDEDPPVEVVRSRRVELRGWRRVELERVFRESGFRSFVAWGGFDKSEWEEATSRDLLLLARA